MLKLSIESIDPVTYEIEVNGNDGVTDIYTTTSPQQTVLKILCEHGIKGKRGRKPGTRVTGSVVLPPA